MGELADAVGVGILFTRNGTEYQCSRVKPYHKAMFEAWVEKQAWEGIDRSKAWVSEATFRTACRELSLGIGAQELAQGSERYDHASKTRAGVSYLLMLMLRECSNQKGFEHQKEINEQWVDQWVEENQEQAARIYNDAISQRPKKKEEPSDGE